MLRLMVLKGYVEAKLGQRGAAIVEYALLLAFVSIIAAALLGSDSNSITTAITGVITKIGTLLGKAEDGAAS